MGIKEKILVCIVAVAAIFAVPEIVPHFYKRVAWDNYSTEGRRLILFGDKDRALSYFKEETQAVLRAGGSKDPRYIATLEGQALAYQKHDMFKSADDQFNEAIATLQKSWVPDRTRIKQILAEKMEMYSKHPEVGSAREVQQKIDNLNPWWQWFWSSFTIVFVAESLYVAHVISKPGDIEWWHWKVEYGMLYLWAVFVATAGMARGLWMHDAPLHESVLWAMAISCCALPAVLATVLFLARNFGTEDARRFLTPTRAGRGGSGDFQRQI